MASNKKESTKSGNDQLSLIEVEELEKAKNVEWHQSSVHTGKYDCSAVKSVGVQTEDVITKVCSCNCSVLLLHHLFMYVLTSRSTFLIYQENAMGCNYYYKVYILP